MNLNQITLPVLNVPRAITFYEKLGLILIVHTHDAYARFESPEGDATFSLHLVDEMPKGEGVWIYFECKELDQKVAELQAQGIVFDELPEDKSWLWREARLKDPDGNQLILYFAGENRKHPPWRKG